MFYLPIISRLKRLFASMETVDQMTWHYDNRKDSNVLRHPCDGQAWKHFDRVHANFVVEPRNVRLGLCSDGFNPYIQASARPYSCWSGYSYQTCGQTHISWKFKSLFRRDCPAKTRSFELYGEQ